MRDERPRTALLMRDGRPRAALLVLALAAATQFRVQQGLAPDEPVRELRVGKPRLNEATKTRALIKAARKQRRKHV